MSKQIVTKICFKCKKAKSLSEFHKRVDAKDGHRNHCKVCRLQQDKKYKKSEKGRASQQRWRDSKKGKHYQDSYYHRYCQTPNGKTAQRRAHNNYKNQHPQRIKIRAIITNAIRYKKLPRANSLVCHCGKQAKQYHHNKGYEPEHRLDVIPICFSCHKEIHKKNLHKTG